MLFFLFFFVFDLLSSFFTILSILESNNSFISFLSFWFFYNHWHYFIYFILLLFISVIPYIITISFSIFWCFTNLDTIIIFSFFYINKIIDKNGFFFCSFNISKFIFIYFKFIGNKIILFCSNFFFKFVLIVPFISKYIASTIFMIWNITIIQFHNFYIIIITVFIFFIFKLFSWKVWLLLRWWLILLESFLFCYLCVYLVNLWLFYYQIFWVFYCLDKLNDLRFLFPLYIHCYYDYEISILFLLYLYYLYFWENDLKQRMTTKKFENKIFTFNLLYYHLAFCILFIHDNWNILWNRFYIMPLRDSWLFQLL